MYELPEIHKRNVPFRPVINFRDEPCRELSAVLLEILTALVKKTYLFIQNWKDFVEKLKEINPHPLFWLSINRN